jgi:diguanylate cyclase
MALKSGTCNKAMASRLETISVMSGNKRYPEGMEKSAEYLRLALPLMSKQKAGLHPLSYAVWYEYVSGGNLALKAAIDAEQTKSSIFDDALIHTLYQRFIAEIDAAQAARISHGFSRVLSDINRSASQAGEEAGRFGHSLERWSDSLNQGDDIAAGVGELLGDTRTMQNTVSQLQEQLLTSQQEIERLKQEVSRAREDALVDALTGLANRRCFEQELENCLQEVNRLNTPKPCVLIADIDYFKRVNDTYGHIFGDKVIRSVAKVLHQSIKGRDMAARYGGEEFVILLPDTPLNGAQALAESIRCMVQNGRIKRHESKDALAQVTVSLGVACYHPGESASEFIGRADLALYASKDQGRNRVTVSL